MTKDSSRSGSLSRRDFVGTMGAVLATGIGCGTDDDGGSEGSDASTGSKGPDANSGSTGPNASTGSDGAGGATERGLEDGSREPSAGTGIEGAGDPPTETALVALVRGEDWAAATERAIAMAGGLPDLTGKQVLLRPNVISNDPAPTTTNPEVIRGVIRAVKKCGAASIQVADDGWATSNTVSSMNDLGIGQVCLDEGAQPLDLKNGPTRKITHVEAKAWPQGMNFYAAVLDADYVINIPVCKSHSMASFTMALKAWYGHVPSADRNHQSLANQIAELHLAKQEDFVVLDATKAMVTGGPQSGQSAESRIVVASKDAIAVDITGLCIHKQFGTKSGAVYNLGVWEQQQIQRALALKFPGWLSESGDFSYAAEGIDEHQAIMAWRDG